jgi:nucleoside permease NupC
MSTKLLKKYINTRILIYILHIHTFFVLLFLKKHLSQGLLAIITSLYENLIRIAQVEFASKDFFTEQMYKTFKSVRNV